MYLLFDLSEKDAIHLALFDEEKRIDITVAGRNRDLLSALDAFLQKEKVDKNDIRGIATVVGAGGFTSTRIAAVVANAFAYAQKIPVIAIKKEDISPSQRLVRLWRKLSTRPAGEYVSATYSGEPNIGRKVS